MVGTTGYSSIDAGAPLPTWRWTDDVAVEVDECDFRFEPTGDHDAFLVLKQPALVRTYERLIHEERPRHIVELGMKAGGSTALLAVAAQPLTLVGLDLESVAPAALADLVERRGLHGSVHVRPGIDQADRSALLAAVTGPLDGAAIDLVIDDASHVLGPTIASFDALFPRVRPGGTYVIEDWASDLHGASRVVKLVGDDPEERERSDRVRALVHLLNDPEGVVPPEVVAALTEAHSRRGPVESSGVTGLVDAIIDAAASVDLDVLRLIPIRAERSLADIVVRLSMVTALAPDVVSSIVVNEHWIVVRRGPADIDQDSFRLEDVATDPFGYLS